MINGCGEIEENEAATQEQELVARIFIVDDDLAMDVLTDSLRFRGHDAQRIASATDALEELDAIVSAHLVVLDIIMPWPEGRTATALAGAPTAGMEVLREVRNRNKHLPVVAYSATQDATVIDAIEDDPDSSFVSKWEGHSLRELIAHIHKRLGLVGEPRSLRPFIVHGHDDVAKLSLKNYLQNTLKLPEPLILHEQPNGGRTVIEKFEDYAAMSSLVFVLLTPDDVAATGGDTDDLKRRARQNVIFEMGYFVGTLGRQSRRVILLYRPPLELPSDLSGVVYIDISQGVEDAGEQIRREVEHAAT
jgi:predicted nucleotide-binding protein